MLRVEGGRGGEGGAMQPVEVPGLVTETILSQICFRPDSLTDIASG